MRDPDNFLLIQKNCFLIRENCFLIREDLIQGGLVLYDRRLIMKQRFLVFQNSSLMAEDCFLIRYNFAF